MFSESDWSDQYGIKEENVMDGDNFGKRVKKFKCFQEKEEELVKKKWT